MTNKTEFDVLLDATLMTQREAAEMLGVAHDTVRAWVKGRRNCPDGVLEELLIVARKSLKSQSIEVEKISRRLSSENRD